MHFPKWKEVAYFTLQSHLKSVPKVPWGEIGDYVGSSRQANGIGICEEGAIHNDVDLH